MNKNTWMTNPVFLAQVGHFLGACLAMVLTAFLFGHLIACFVVAGLFVPAAAIKEFFYDLRFEVPTQSISDSALDFGFYMLGLLVGLGIVGLKLRVW